MCCQPVTAHMPKDACVRTVCKCSKCRGGKIKSSSCQFSFTVACSALSPLYFTSVLLPFYYFVHGSAKYCDQRACLYSVCLSVRSHISKTPRPCRFTVTWGCGWFGPPVTTVQYPAGLNRYFIQWTSVCINKIACPLSKLLLLQPIFTVKWFWWNAESEVHAKCSEGGLLLVPSCRHWICQKNWWWPSEGYDVLWKKTR